MNIQCFFSISKHITLIGKPFIFPVRLSATTGPMAVLEAPETTGNFGMLSDAALYPSNLYLLELTQTSCICLRQLDHSGFHSTEASEVAARSVEGQSAQCQTQGCNDIFILYGFVEVPNFKRPLRNPTLRA